MSQDDGQAPAPPNGNAATPPPVPDRPLFTLPPEYSASPSHPGPPPGYPPSLHTRQPSADPPNQPNPADEAAPDQDNPPTDNADKSRQTSHLRPIPDDTANPQDEGGRPAAEGGVSWALPEPSPAPGNGGIPGTTAWYTPDGSHRLAVERQGYWPETVRPPERPRFEPPTHPTDGHPYPGSGMTSVGGEASMFWSLVGGLASLLLLVSPFLTWVNVEWQGGLLGQVIATASSDQTGMKADGTGSIVTLSGCAGLGVILAGLALRRARTVALSAVPGGIALVACCVFAIRVHSGEHEIGGLTDLPSGLGNVTLSLGVGWYLALAGSLILLGTGLAIATRARPPAPTVPLTPPTPMPPPTP